MAVDDLTLKTFLYIRDHSKEREFRTTIVIKFVANSRLSNYAHMSGGMGEFRIYPKLDVELTKEGWEEMLEKIFDNWDDLEKLSCL